MSLLVVPLLYNGGISVLNGVKINLPNNIGSIPQNIRSFLSSMRFVNGMMLIEIIAVMILAETIIKPIYRTVSSLDHAYMSIGSGIKTLWFVKKKV